MKKLKTNDSNVTTAFSAENVIARRIERLVNATNIQCSQGNWNNSEYMHGMANGLIFAESIMCNKTAKFLTKPSKWLNNEKALTLNPECSAVDRADSDEIDLQLPEPRTINEAGGEGKYSRFIPNEPTPNDEIKVYPPGTRPLGSKLNSDDPKFEKLKLIELVTQMHCDDGTWNDNPYAHGLANGHINVLCMLKNETLEYLKQPTQYICDKKSTPVQVGEIVKEAPPTSTNCIAHLPVNHKYCCATLYIQFKPDTGMLMCDVGDWHGKVGVLEQLKRSDVNWLLAELPKESWVDVVIQYRGTEYYSIDKIVLREDSLLEFKCEPFISE